MQGVGSNQGVASGQPRAVPGLPEYSSGSFCFNSAGNAGGLPKRRAVGRREEARRDLGPCKTRRKGDHERRQGDESEKRWVCKFCDRTLQGGPNIIMAHHGAWKRQKDVQRCRHAPPDARARRTSSFAGIVRNAVQSTEFWQEVDIFVTVLQRIYATLRANDSEVPGTPDIYFRMSSGLADVQTNEWELPDGTSFKFSPAERKVVLDAYKQRWDMLYNRLHALGLVLNPLLHSKHKFDGTCMVETRQYTSTPTSRANLIKPLDAINSSTTSVTRRASSTAMGPCGRRTCTGHTV